MKKITGYVNIIGLVCILAVAGCGSSGGATAGAGDNPNVVKVNRDNTQLTLADYLRKVSGVNVYGSGNNISVQIRGVNSFRGGATHPLFVVDGQRVGKNYQSVSSLINVYDVDRIEVLKGADASIYGVEGGGGVIVIHTMNN